MKTPIFPDWVPQVNEGARILVVGASGGIGQAVVSLLFEGPECVIGAHRDSSPAVTSPEESTNHVLVDLQSHLEKEEDCTALVESFVEKAGGIDGIVVLTGAMTTEHLSHISAEQWEGDIQTNLNIPFYLARAAMKRMPNGGSVVLTGTESAIHGGSPTSFPYGIAKRGTECMVQGLARDGASSAITVNGVRMGFICSGTHERWQNKSEEDIKKRAEMVLLKRGGDPREAAALILYLLSGWATFITGQMIPLTGGDWL